MTKSSYLCPACGQPLSMKLPMNFVILYCGHAKCDSTVSKQGVIAGTEERAFEQLKRAVVAEDTSLQFPA